MGIGHQEIRRWMALCAETYDQQQAFLNELDAVLGDGDHGRNMRRGCAAVKAQLSTDEEPETLLKQIARTLLSALGGVTGPLYFSFFQAAAETVAGKRELTLADLAALLQAGVEGMAQQGRVRPGEKTLCDVWWPVAQAVSQTEAEGGSLTVALQQAERAARAAFTSTGAMAATKGHAASRGENSIGHPDPGAASAMLMVACLRQAVAGDSKPRDPVAGG